jgi:hypothetical protein
MSVVGMVLAWQLFGPLARVIYNWAIQWLYPGMHYY